MVVDEKRKVILGVTFVGQDVSELLQAATIRRRRRDAARPALARGARLSNHERDLAATARDLRPAELAGFAPRGYPPLASQSVLFPSEFGASSAKSSAESCCSEFPATERVGASGLLTRATGRS